MARAKGKGNKEKKTANRPLRHLPAGSPGVPSIGKNGQVAELRHLEGVILSLSQEQMAETLARIPVSVQTAGYIARLARLCAEHDQVEKGASLVAWALAALPDHPDLLAAGGLVQAKAGNTQFAVDCYEAVLEREPEHVEALANLTDLLVKVNQWSYAIPFLVRLARLRPDNPLVFRFLGTAYIKTNQFEEALSAFQHGLSIEPDSIEFLINMGVCLRQMRRYEEAERYFQRALSRSPDHPELHNSLAWLYSDLHDYDKAVAHARRACALQPNNINFLYCHGYLLRRYNRRAEARAVFKKALAIDPGDSTARFGYAELILAEGELVEGLACYESRFDVMQSWLTGPWPVWDGTNPEGKTLFVHHEQGVGDTIQFCRYLPLLHQADAKVLFSCQPSLVSLMRRLPGIDRLYPANEVDYAIVRADAQVSLLSLMGVFGTTMATIPAACPYLHADPESVVRLGRLLPPTGKYKVGIIWAGNPAQAEDHNRSLHLRQLAPLTALRDAVQFYSLQMGYATEQIGQYGPPLGLIDLSPHIASFDDTAAFMTHMDLIVSVCTSTIHLAGALARPAVVLLHSAADWRWFLDRQDSPWYPSVHLIRQSAPRQWQPVVEELIRYIGQRQATNRSGRE